jgi:hypothetical protein
MGWREIEVCWASPGTRHFVKSRDAVVLAAALEFQRLQQRLTRAHCQLLDAQLLHAGA